MGALEESLLNESIAGYTQFYFGLSFVCFVILALFIPRHHDQLGLWTETVCYFVLAGIAFPTLLFIQFTFNGTEKRVASFLGATLALFLINFICFYIVMIVYDGYRFVNILNGNGVKNKMDNGLNDINANDMELAAIMSSARTYNSFRTFLGDIFCVENIDFVTLIQCYRAYVKNGCIVNENDKVVRRHSKTPSFGPQKETISQIIVDEQGSKNLDIRKLKLDFVQIPNEWKELKDINAWIEWIVAHYIMNGSMYCLNLSSKTRRYYIEQFEKVMNENDNEAISTFFDRAQAEIWTLMARDSLVHFRNSNVYSQVMWKENDAEL